MRFSIVIPTHNRVETLRQTLRAATTQTYDDYEVLVVDDGSSDGTADIVAREFPTVRLIRQPNRGPAAARNQGIQESTGEIIAFTDDDCVPPPDWLTRLADGYARHPEVAGVGGSLKAPEAILAKNIIAQYEQHVARVVYRAGDVESIGGFACPAGGTNNMSYHRNVLLQVGGFDVTFPYAAGEDADLKWRICQTGAPLLYVPIKVVHLQPYTWSHFRQQQIARGRGAVCFERKHRGRAPSRIRVLLRLVKRAAQMMIQLALGPRRRLAFVRFAAGWYDCIGQLIEIQDLHP